jgi:hypothetical protein
MVLRFDINKPALRAIVFSRLAVRFASYSYPVVSLSFHGAPV